MKGNRTTKSSETRGQFNREYYEALRTAYQAEYARGYIFLTSCHTKEADLQVGKLKSAGFDAILRSADFNSPLVRYKVGRKYLPKSEFKVILVRPNFNKERQTLDDALEALTGKRSVF